MRDRYRAVMARFATGVTVVTATGPDGPVGMTANAITSLSLEPLLLIVCFDKSSRTLPVVRHAGVFAVNVLAAGQEELARVFASKAPETAKFAGVAHRLQDGVPLIEGVHAWLGCRLHELVPGGDHMIGVAGVTAAEFGEGEPLVWYGGHYGGFAAERSA